MIKTVTILSHAAAEQYLPKIGEAIISITEPGAPLARLRSGWTDTLRVQFGDVEYNRQTIEYYGPSWQSVKGVFRAEHAHAIREFLQRVENNPRMSSLVVHCHAGVSRSAAVGTYAARRNNLAVSSSWSGKNLTVLEVLETPDCYDWAWTPARTGVLARAWQWINRKVTRHTPVSD